MENLPIDAESAAIAHAIKQRHGSIYTVTSEHSGNVEAEKDNIQRRMSRVSRKSSGRTGVNLTVPIINNVFEPDGSSVTTAEVLENSRMENVLQTPTYQVTYKYCACFSSFLYIFISFT